MPTSEGGNVQSTRRLTQTSSRAALIKRCGLISVTARDLHFLAFPDETKAIKSQDGSEKVVEKKEKEQWWKKKEQGGAGRLCWAIRVTSFLGSSHRPGPGLSHPFLPVCFLLHIF